MTHPFLKQVFTSLRGSVLAQLVGVLAIPILAKIYAPSDFGVLQSLQSVLALLLIASSLRFELAILTSTEREVGSVITICLWLTVATALIAGIAATTLYIIQPSFVSSYGATILITPFALLFAGWGQICVYIGLRHQNLSVNATAKPIQSLIYAASGILGGLVSPTSFVLVASEAAGRLSHFTASLRKEVIRTLRSRPPLRLNLRFVAWKNRALPTLSLPSALLNTLGSSFTAFMLVALFDTEEAGNYAIVERSLGIPVAMLAAATSQAFMAALSKKSESSLPITTLMVNIIKTNATIALPPTLVLFFFGPQIVPAILGEEWVLAGEFSRVLAPLLYVSFIASPLNMTLALTDRQSWQFAWDATRLVTIAAMWWWVSAHNLEPIDAIKTYTAVGIFFYIIHVMLSYKSLKRGLETQSKEELKCTQKQH